MRLREHDIDLRPLRRAAGAIAASIGMSAWKKVLHLGR